jgi:hypothetical protein
VRLLMTAAKNLRRASVLAKLYRVMAAAFGDTGLTYWPAAGCCAARPANRKMQTTRAFFIWLVSFFCSAPTVAEVKSNRSRIHLVIRAVERIALSCTAGSDIEPFTSIRPMRGVSERAKQRFYCNNFVEPSWGATWHERRP